jgi:hypothetical protein
MAAPSTHSLSAQHPEPVGVGGSYTRSPGERRRWAWRARTSAAEALWRPSMLAGPPASQPHQVGLAPALGEPGVGERVAELMGMQS